MSRWLTATIAGIGTGCVHFTVQFVSWASHSGQLMPGPSNWDLIWDVTSLPTFAVLRESVINTQFEALLLMNSMLWSIVGAVLVYVLKGRR